MKQCFQNKTDAFKGNESRCRKQSKLRVRPNQSAKEKLPPLITGISKKSRCFAKIESFLMLYSLNIKALNSKHNCTMDFDYCIL